MPNIAPATSETKRPRLNGLEIASIVSCCGAFLSGVVAAVAIALHDATSEYNKHYYSTALSMSVICFLLYTIAIPLAFGAGKQYQKGQQTQHANAWMIVSLVFYVIFILVAIGNITSGAVCGPDCEAKDYYFVVAIAFSIMMLIPWGFMITYAELSRRHEGTDTTQQSSSSNNSNNNNNEMEPIAAYIMGIPEVDAVPVTNNGEPLPIDQVPAQSNSLDGEQPHVHPHRDLPDFKAQVNSRTVAEAQRVAVAEATSDVEQGVDASSQPELVLPDYKDQVRGAIPRGAARAHGVITPEATLPSDVVQRVAASSQQNDLLPRFQDQVRDRNEGLRNGDDAAVPQRRIASLDDKYLETIP